MDHPPDEKLIAQCAQGDRRAMDLLVSRHHAKLLDFAFRHLRDRDAAADIAQTALLRAFQAAGSYRVKTSFRSWLYTIALNLIRDEGRRRKSRKESPSSEIEGLESINPQPSPEAATLDRIEASKIWQAVEILPESQRSAVILRFRQELTYEEIAEVMEAPIGTVKSWVHYALKTLKGSLDPTECEG